MTEFVVGVDGGGTRTRAVAMDLEGEVVGRAQGPAGLLQPHNAGAVAAAVREAAAEAAAQAGLSLPASFLYAGVAGAGRPALRLALTVALSQAGVAAGVEVDTDIAVAVRDGLDDGPGVVLLSGTGSIAWGRSADGRERRVGGWGMLLGDQGSGYAIGLAGLRAVARAADGLDPATPLTDALVAAAGVAAPDELIAWVSVASKADVAALAPVVASLAPGDPVAEGIVEQAAADLADQAAAVARHLEPWPETPVRVVLAGGVLSPHEPTRERVAALLTAAGFDAPPDEVDGARGAARMALERLG